MEYVKLVLSRNNRGDKNWLACQKTTADFFGWTDHYEPWRAGSTDPETGKTTNYLIRRSSTARVGGHRLRICRSADKGGWIAGMTHCFRISGGVSNTDLCELAYLTKGDWGWMETRYHERRSRDCWRAIYEGAITFTK